MREGFNNQLSKNKIKNIPQQLIQNSHRGVQPHHQKANSMSIKTGQGQQQLVMMYEEQQQQLKKNI